MSTLAETPVARCGSQADCPPGTNRLPTHQRTGTKAPPNAARAPCAPPIQQPTGTRKLPHADLPAGPPRRPLPAPKGGGARVPGRAAPPLHAPALRARGGRWSAALGDGARSGLSLPAAHRAPSPSSPGPSRGAHTHLTSARIKARGAAPDGGPQRSGARLRCSRCSRTARPESSTCLLLQRMLQAGRGRGRGRKDGRRGQDLQPNSSAALAPGQPPADLTAGAARAHRPRRPGCRGPGCCPLPAMECPDLEFSSPEGLKEALL